MAFQGWSGGEAVELLPVNAEAEWAGGDVYQYRTFPRLVKNGIDLSGINNGTEITSWNEVQL